MESASSVVIKVKHGDVLRRFNALIVDDQLDFDIDSLREKILSLFSFPPETELTLTYIDEDGDVVTLIDDNDLRDVVKQALNPLRITVKLNTGKNGKQFTRARSVESGSSTPLRSPRVQDPMQNLNAGISEILRAVPEPLRETIVKVSSGLTSKASSSTPVIAELVDLFTKVGLSYLGQSPETQPEVQVSKEVPAEVKGLDTTKSDTVGLEVPVNKRSEAISCESNENSTKIQTEASKENNVACGKVTEVETSSSKAPAVMTGLALSNSKNIFVSKKEKIRKEKLKKMSEGYSNEKLNQTSPHIHSSSKPVPVVNNVPGEDVNNGSCSLDNWTKPVFPDGSFWGPASGGSNFPGPLSYPGFKHEYPFPGTAVGNPPCVPPRPVIPAPFSFRRGQIDGNGTVFHRGVRCDGCGIHPITGPRYKSKVKVDYDLCSICFSEMGNDSDYIKMDRPAFYRPPLSFKDLYDSAPVLSPCSRGYKAKSGGFKLDSRFIQDVNIVDGTIVEPSTPFTKIWRMRNNGTVMWPPKTQLVWIGGDKLSSELSVEIEVPEAGVPVDHELDIAVDFVAPLLPGRYISYWRMALPSGQKFGQRVWVLIQVLSSVKETRAEVLGGLNLNLPPVHSSGFTGPEIINLDPEPMADETHPEPNLSKKAVEIVEPVIDLQPKNENETKFPINDSLLVSGGASSSSMPPASAPVSYPVIDFPDVGTFSSVSPTAVANALSSSTAEIPGTEIPGTNDMEEKLLRELEEMGFKQVDLNKEVLRMNGYDLGQTVEDLFVVTEWDPILEELQEMGFHDTEMNKKLLKKNNGSIKRVVMDLIAGEQ